MKSWRTTIGGAFSSAGSVLIGIGVVPQLAGAPSRVLLYVAVAGFVLQALGTFFAHLFAADTQSVQRAIDAAAPPAAPLPSPGTGEADSRHE